MQFEMEMIAGLPMLVASASTEYLEWCSWITCDAVSRAVELHTEPFEL